MRGSPPRSDISRPSFREHFPYGGLDLVLISDPFADPLWKGEPILGWEGDNRLALYLAPRQATWALVRYCEDRSLQVIKTVPATPGSAVNVVGELIGFLLGHDSRRGVNPIAEAAAHNDAQVARVDANLERWVSEEGAPRAAKALLGSMDR